MISLLILKQSDILGIDVRNIILKNITQKHISILCSYQNDSKLHFIVTDVPNMNTMQCCLYLHIYISNSVPARTSALAQTEACPRLLAEAVASTAASKLWPQPCVLQSLSVVPWIKVSADATDMD